MKALFDLNVVLDVLMDRDPWVQESRAAVQLVLDHKVAGYVSAISITTLYYIVRRAAGQERARMVVERCLEVFDVAAVDQAVLRTALAIPSGSDFEDCVQFVSAQAAGADAIVTRDAGGFAGSAVPVHTPQSLVQNFGGA